MKDIQEIVNNKVQEMIEGGLIQKRIEDAIQNSIESAIESQFRSYGDITRQIEEAFKEGFKIDKSKIDFDCYNQVMLSAVKGKLNQYFAEESSSKFMKQLDEIFSPAPKEMDIKDFVEQIISEWKSCNETYYDWEDYAEVNLKENNYPLRGYSLEMCVKETGYRSSKEKELSLYIGEDGDIRLSHKMQYNPTTLFGDDAIVFRLYSSGTKLVNLDSFDPDDCDLYVGMHEGY
ncbi:hypothetical protein phiV208_50 [Vibrio phage phiV208]|nr:hypothetical protein phiV208_50 [Vibrio phage phiV208]